MNVTYKPGKYPSGTFLNSLYGDLLKNGMFDHQATPIMEAFIADQRGSGMGSRFFDDPSGYPPVLYQLQWRLLCTYALAYIDEECPKAWFRPVFLPPNEQEAWLAQNGYSPKENPI